MPAALFLARDAYFFPGSLFPSFDDPAAMAPSAGSA
jgi:hypothetical protein